MFVGYKKRWHLLINKSMQRKVLRNLIEINTASISKPSEGEDIGTDFLLKICGILDFVIMEIERGAAMPKVVQ